MSLVDVRPSDGMTPGFDPYHLTPEQVVEREAQFFDAIRESQGDQGDLYSVWLSPDSPHVDLVKTEEAKKFPEIPEIVASYEGLCLFLAIADMRDGRQELVHAFRFSGRSEGGSTEMATDVNGDQVQLTGMPFIDDIVLSGQGLDGAQFADFYAKNGTRLERSISVETNFRIKETEPYNGLRISDVGYLALFNHVERGQLDEGELMIFAHLNTPAIKSLGGLGVEYEDIAGVPGLKTPTVGEVQFDDKYAPVAIPSNAHNLAIFRDLAVFGAPEVHL